MVKLHLQSKNQRGMSLFGMLFILGALAMIALLGMKIFPTYSEYRAILDGIKEAKQAGDTPAAIRSAFGRSAVINNIETINAADLVISKETGETQVSIAYEKRIALFGPVSLLIDYYGSTDPRAQATSGAAGSKDPSTSL
jgi:hypothetical protein